MKYLKKAKINHMVIIQYLKRIILFLLEFIIVTNFILILLYIITGGFTYSHLKIAGTEIEIHGILIPTLMFLVLLNISNWLKKIWRFNNRVLALVNPIYYFIIVLFIYNAILIPFYLFMYYSFNIGHPGDFALYNQAFYTTIHGIPQMVTCYGYIPKAWNLLADHFTLVPLFLSPFYYIFQDGRGMIVIQTITIAMGAIPIYFIAKKKLKNEWIGLAISLIYLLYPKITTFYYNSFRWDYFSMVLFLYAFWCMETNHKLPLLIIILFAILCKETIFLSAILFGLYIFIFKKGFKAQGIIMIISSIILGILIWKHIMPNVDRFVMTGHSAYRRIRLLEGLKSLPLQELLNSVWIVGKHFIRESRILCYIPLLNPIILIGLGTFVENLIGFIFFDGPHYVAEAVWHSAMFIPPLFLAYIYGIHYLLKYTQRPFIQKNITKTIFFISVIGLPLFITIEDFDCRVIKEFVRNNLATSFKPPIYNQFINAYKYLPTKGVILTNYKSMPNLSNREDIYFLGYHPEKLDYLFYSHAIALDTEIEPFTNMLRGNDYEIIYNSEFIVATLKENISKTYGPVFNFSDELELSQWEFNLSNVNLKHNITRGGLYISMYLDGDSSEDEFVQLKRYNPQHIDTKQYPYLELLFKIENPSIQLIELVLGIDFNNDNNIDTYIKNLYMKDVIPNVYNKYRLNVYEMLKDGFPNKKYYNILAIELYPHKYWNFNCKGSYLRGWYRFWIKRLSLFNLRPTHKL